jgi:predicted DNA-binding protein YlxM (UPF0122 family)
MVIMNLILKLYNLLLKNGKVKILNIFFLSYSIQNSANLANIKRL